MIHHRDDVGLWWPDHCQKPKKVYELLMKRRADIDVALRHVRGRGVCVQAGGHVGIWPMRLSQEFARVLTFEPDPALARCLDLNCRWHTNVEVSDCALGNSIGIVRMTEKRSSGTWFIEDAGTVPVKQTTLDSLELDACDLLMLDVERYEVEAMRGAARTISKFRPVIVVEELVGSREGIQAHMHDIGYRAVGVVSSDVVYQDAKR